MTVLESDLQAANEEIELKQQKINDMSEHSAKQAAVIRNLVEGHEEKDKLIAELTKERDLLQQQVESIHFFTDPDFGVQQ